MRKYLYNVLIYISLIFLCVMLYNADYLIIPKIDSLLLLIISLIFLFSGFIGHAYSWKKILEQANFHTGIDTCIASIGLSIFGKYIPGKIWMIIGRSAYISAKGKYDMKELSVLSLDAQLVALLTGLLLGFIGVMYFDGFRLLGMIIISLLIGLCFFIFSPFLHQLILKVHNAILQQKMVLVQLSAKQILKTIPWFAGYWVLWAIGFYFLSASLAISSIPFFSGLGFPLAVTLGIAAFISPGGLGIREGALTGFLILAGLPANESTTIAITSRLWFLIGEFFIFMIGWILHRLHLQK